MAAGWTQMPANNELRMKFIEDIKKAHKGIKVATIDALVEQVP